jgi:hypothetical protein
MAVTSPTFTGTTTTGQSQQYADPQDWYNQYLADLTATGGLLAQEEYTPYGGPRIAEWTPDQQAAFARVRDSLDMWKPYAESGAAAYQAGLGGLDQMRQMTQQAGTFDRPTFENTYLDIYMDPAREMQQAAEAIGQRNFQNTTLKSLNDAFTGTGQFGSSRNQILGADAAAMAQAQIEEAKASIGMQATQNAMGDYLNWAKQQGAMGGQMGTYGANEARMGTDLMNFGAGTQQLAQGDAASLGNIGTQQQQQNQQNLNLAYEDFMKQQNYPWEQLDKWSALTRGQSIPTYQNTSVPQVTAPTATNPWVAGAVGGLGAWQSMSSSFR